MTEVPSQEGARDTTEAGAATVARVGVDPLAVVGLVLGFLVGIVGAALGVIALRRVNRTGRPGRSVAIAAIVVGLVQTALVVAFLAGVFDGRGGSGQPGEVSTSGVEDGLGPTPGQEASDGATPSDEGSPSDGSDESEGPLESEEPLEGALVDSTNGFTSDGLSTNADLVEEGADEAYDGSFTNGRDEITFTASRWGSAEEAADYLQAKAAEVFSSGELVDQGPAGDPVSGQYWYFESGGVATIYWTNGVDALEASGPPLQVQEFYLAYPL